MQDNNKIKQFMSDAVMEASVKEVIRETFLKASKSTDTNYLAGKMIAIELLGEAWRELEKRKSKEQEENKPRGQVGV